MSHDFEQVKRKRTKMAWMPATITTGGLAENLIQGFVEKDGPERGHWAHKPKSNGMISQMSGKRKWIKGQHNYNRQHNPKNQQENILGTRLMNENAKMVKVVDDNGNYVKELVDNAKIIRYGMMRQVEVTTHDDIFTEATRLTKQVLGMKSASENRGVNSDASGSLGIRVGGGLVK